MEVIESLYRVSSLIKDKMLQISVLSKKNIYLA